MNSAEIIYIYETVSDITQKMVIAARNGDWDHFSDLEMLCSDQVELLRQAEPSSPLIGKIREKKIQIIHKILANDREIRSLTEPWMAQLANLIKSSSTERKLTRAYGE